MAGWLARILGREDASEDPLLALERDAQCMRLAVAQLEEALRSVKAALGRQREEEEGRIAAALEAVVRGLAEEVAAPLAHLGMQRYLIQAEGTSLRAQDVLAVADQILRVFEDRGVELHGAVGAPAAFDPDRHEPIGEAGGVAPGHAVVVRVPGVWFRGTVLRKAGVERV